MNRAEYNIARAGEEVRSEEKRGEGKKRSLCHNERRVYSVDNSENEMDSTSSRPITVVQVLNAKVLHVSNLD